MLKNFKQIALRSIERDYVQSITKRMVNGKYVFLMYHGVSADDHCSKDWLQLRESDFRDQMEHLKANYDVVSMRDVLNDTVTETRTGPNIVITFDDGYANNYHYAYPILKELGLPATIFLVTSMIDTDRMFWFDKLFSCLPRENGIEWVTNTIESFKDTPPNEIDATVDAWVKDHGYTIRDASRKRYANLRTEQIAEMADSGLITFGSHTHNHELLTKMNDYDVEATLRTSFHILESLPGSIPVACYPNGWFNPSHLEISRDIGYQMAVRADHNIDGVWEYKPGDLEIPRWGIGRGMCLAKYTTIVSGALHVLRCLSRKL